MAQVRTSVSSELSVTYQITRVAMMTVQLHSTRVYGLSLERIFMYALNSDVGKCYINALWCISNAMAS